MTSRLLARSWLFGSALIAAVMLDALVAFSGAQPAPSFRSTCTELRKAVADLDFKDGQLVVFEVVGTLTIVHTNGALVYLGMCTPPDPYVLCVTYETNGRQIGNEAVLTGTYVPRGPNHIQLDPCLHGPPDS